MPNASHSHPLPDSARALPVVIIGGGPVGLAAAAHLLARGFEPLVLEAGDRVGAGMGRWSHVRMFSPWRYAIDREAAALLAREGWTAPPEEAYPTGGEVVSRYLQPLAETAALAPRIALGARVTSVTREGHDRMKDGRRARAAFLVRVSGPDGERDVPARAVVDASGTILSPAPLGASGVPAIGERAAADHIVYGIPDVLGSDRARFGGRRTLVVGSGHSAFNVLLDLATLADQAPGTVVQWAIRREAIQQVLGGGDRDRLAERGRLGQRIAALIGRGAAQVATSFHLDRVDVRGDGIVVSSGARALDPVDTIVATTGFRPDWSLLSELRLDLDPAVESPRALAPLIDPNVHSCGTVPPHGAEQLKHPDADVFVVGMKSYGRAPTFLLLTGYEQVRSVAAAIAGDWDAARRVELVLPETGVCRTDDAAAGAACCGASSDAAGLVTAIPVTVPATVARGGAVASVSSCCS
jgi:thioredoxin reductase